MAAGAGLTWAERLPPWGFLALLGAFLTALGCYGLPARAVSVDYICYYSAAGLLVSGRSPYDLAAETEAQQALGWDKATDGFGKYDYLPYFYPPWFALACAALLPLGYPAGKVAFFALNIALALASGRLLRGPAKGVPGWAPSVLVPLFVFSVVCVLLAQTSLIVLFLIVIAWTLLEEGRDRAAGVVLAWLTIKPQLTAVLLLGVLLWAVRRRRWGVPAAFAVTLGLLAGVCTLLVPSWPVQMLQAPRQSPLPTEFYPWIGNAWFLLLRAVGVEGWGLLLLYLPAAAAALLAVVRVGFDRSRPLAEVLAAGVLAAFFVAPYARHYDFAVLVVPFFVLWGTRLPRAAGTALLLALVVLPYVQFIILDNLKVAYHPEEKFVYECTFFWVPLLLTAAWLAAGSLPSPRYSGERGRG
jgi:hypothetical protein